MPKITLPFKSDLDMRDKEIQQVSTPADGADGIAANKGYADTKVAKEDGKGLSSNDFTDDDHNKLDGIAAGAQVNVGVEYTQDEKTKLGGIAEGAQVNVGVEYTQDEKTKLGGIAEGAQVNVGVEYTQTEKTKLGTYPNQYSTVTNLIGTKQDNLPTLNEGRVWTADSDGAIVQEVIDIVGIADANSPDGTPAGEEIQNLVINTASAGNDALGRWPTTEAWQKDTFELKGEGSFTDGDTVRLGAGSTLGASDPGVAIATTDDITPEATLPTIGFASMLVDAGAGSGSTPNWVGFKPLMTGIATNGTDANLNFAVEEASDDYKDHVTTREWQEARLLEKVTALPALTNPTPAAGDSVYLTTGANPGPYTYEAGTTNNWVATGGSSNGSSVKVNDTDVANPNFKADQSTNPAEAHLYSPAFENDAGTVSVQIDDREILPTLQAEVSQIIEELSNPGGYVWAEEDIFQTVFLTNRSNSSGTQDQTLILQPHFVDSTNIFTTYAVLPGTADTGLRNDWNGASDTSVVIGIGPDVPDLIAFQLVSTFYRDTTAQGLAEIRLQMIDPDGDFPGPSDTGTNTNKEQFITWISNNVSTDTNPIEHSGVNTYYYETTNDFLDTVRHNLGSHFSGSSLTPDERKIVDNLTVQPNVLQTVTQGNEGSLTFTFENLLTGAEGSLVTAGDPIVRSQHTTEWSAATPPASLGLPGSFGIDNTQTNADGDDVVIFWIKTGTVWARYFAQTAQAGAIDFLTSSGTSDDFAISPDSTGAAMELDFGSGVGVINNLNQLNGPTVGGIAIGGVSSITGTLPLGATLTNIGSINGVTFESGRELYLRVKGDGTFQNPPTLETALTTDIVTVGVAEPNINDDTTAHKEYNGVQYYLRYQTYGTNQNRAILTTVADTTTALHVHNIT